MNGLRLLSSRFAGRAAQAAAALTLLCSMTACNTADPIVGEWQSDRRLENGERNQMFFYSDNSGEAEIYASPPGQPGVWLRIDFETEWTEFAGSEFEIEMKCDDDECNSSDDFELDCLGFKQNGGDLKLDCDGDGKWASYVFNWEKVN